MKGGNSKGLMYYNDMIHKLSTQPMSVDADELGGPFLVFSSSREAP